VKRFIPRRGREEGVLFQGDEVKEGLDVFPWASLGGSDEGDRLPPFCFGSSESEDRSCPSLPRVSFLQEKEEKMSTEFTPFRRTTADEGAPPYFSVL